MLGTHGTTQTRAKTIQREGQFRPARKAGRAGTGVYFWAYQNDPSLAHLLANMWWEQCSKEGRYKSDPFQACKVIYVTLKTDDHLYFDMGDPFFQELIFKTAQERAINTVNELSQLYDWALNELEIALKIKYLVISANVPKPRVDQMPQFLLMTNFKCYVVRGDFKKVISIDSIV